MIVRKDNHKFAEIPIRISEKRISHLKKDKSRENVDYFAIELGDKKYLMGNGETLEVAEGEKIKILDVFPSGMDGITVNFKGFVGDKRNNTGEDRGYEIDTAKGLMKRYSIHKKGVSYPIVVTRGDEIIGQLIIKLVEPKLNYLILHVNDEKYLFLKHGDSVSLSMNDRICIAEVSSNFQDILGIQMEINGNKIKNGEKKKLGELCSAKSNQFHILNGPILLGKIFIEAE
jgi:hypothetical protein